LSGNGGQYTYMVESGNAQSQGLHCTTTLVAIVHQVQDG
jgi:hypothetical protein